MGLEKIKEEILQKAAVAEKQILSDASIKINEIKNEAEEKVKKMEQDTSQKLQAEIKSIENRETSLANMESQKMMFEVKKEILDKVYRQAFDKIIEMPNKDRKIITENLLDMASKEIDVDVVFANSKDKDHCEGKDITVKPLETDGGIICETKDGNIRVNYTFDNIFSELKEKTAKEVSKILFD